MLRWLAVFVLGAALCTALDHQHVVWGVLSYPAPDFWEQAWWVPLLFGTATVIAVLSVEPMRRLLGGAPTTETPMALVVFDLAGCAAAYYFTAVGQQAPDQVAAVLVLAWIIRVLAGLPAWAVAFCIGTAIVGPAFEGTWSALGFFHYHHPDFIGVARWLPALYLHVGVAAVSLGCALRAAPVAEPIEIEVAV